MGKKSDPPPAPDLTPYANASAEGARLAQQTAQEQLAWAKEQDALNRGTLNRVLDTQLPIMDQQFQNAQADRSRYENVFQPLENNLVNEFQNYGTDQRKQFERGRAMGDVATSFDAARRNALQRLEGFGVDPSQTRNAALDIGVRTQQAAAQAGAGTAATQRVEDTGRALRADAINIGRGLPSQVATSYGQSIAAGQAGVGGANSTTGASVNAMNPALGFTNAAQSGFGNAGNIMSQGYGNQMQAYNAQQQANAGLMGGIGQIAGMAAGTFLADGGMPRRQGITIDHGTGQVVGGPSDGSGVDDQVPAMLSVGEYVVPADVVAAKGREFFDRLKEKYHTPAQHQRRALAVGA